jgi:autotransporter adhesin
MATKRRISELPICETFKGLFTIGVDALNHSVKVSLEFIDKTVSTLKSSVETAIKNAETATLSANTAAGNANTATSNANAATNATLKATEDCTAATGAANEATEECREIIETASNLEALGLFPTSMTLSYPAKLTRNNKVARINAVLHPDRVYQNVICLGDNKAVSVTPDGLLQVIGKGVSVIHVIPSCNVALYRTIQIEVIEPTIRLVTRQSIRFTSNGKFRLN